MDFSLNLFSEGDWKKLEDTLFRAMVRASRVIAREGTVTGFKPPAETTVVPPEAPPPSPREPHPAFRVPEPMKSPPPPAPGEPVREALPEGRKRASPVPLTKIIRTVEHRPHGWIERQDAQALIGHTTADRTALSQWIRDREVDAAIVTNVKGPPTKGLPGKVFVDKDGLMKRMERRADAIAEMQRSGSGKVGKLHKDAEREKRQATG